MKISKREFILNYMGKIGAFATILFLILTLDVAKEGILQRVFAFFTLLSALMMFIGMELEGWDEERNIKRNIKYIEGVIANLKELDESSWKRKLRMTLFRMGVFNGSKEELIRYYEYWLYQLKEQYRILQMFRKERGVLE